MGKELGNSVIQITNQPSIYFEKLSKITHTVRVAGILLNAKPARFQVENLDQQLQVI
jgi:hypothetical protein